jgi:thymidylate synthase (FAD)
VGFDAEAGLEILNTMAGEQAESGRHYHEYLDAGVAKELARINLPLSTYTEWYWTMDLNNLIKFMGLRSDGHAQKEVRVYSEAIEWFVSQVTPWAYAAYENHVKYGVHLSKNEAAVVKAFLAAEGSGSDEGIAEQFSFLLRSENPTSAEDIAKWNKQVERSTRILLEKFALNRISN